MGLSSIFESQKDLTIFTAEGDLTFDEQMAALKGFYGGIPTANVIWDFRGLQGTRISSEELQEIISYIKRDENKRLGGKTALVSATDLDFGLSRMSEMYAEAEELPWKIKAFRSMDEALRWLDSEAPGA
jgi:hypothetical protein